MWCAMFGCNSDNRKNNKDTHFYRLPKDINLARKWIVLCRRADKINTKYARICSRHFSVADYKRNLKHELLQYACNNYRALKDEAAPNLYLPNEELKSESLLQKVKDRENRAAKREHERKMKILKSASNNLESVAGNRVQVETNLEIQSSMHKNIGINTENDNISEMQEVQSSIIITKADDRDEIILTLQRKIKLLERRDKAISNLFSEEQMKKLLADKAKLKCSIEDISKAVSIYASGPRTY